MRMNRKDLLHGALSYLKYKAIRRTERRDPFSGPVILSRDAVFFSYCLQLCQQFSCQRFQGGMKLIIIECSLAATTKLDPSK